MTGGPEPGTLSVMKIRGSIQAAVREAMRARRWPTLIRLLRRHASDISLDQVCELVEASRTLCGVTLAELVARVAAVPRAAAAGRRPRTQTDEAKAGARRTSAARPSPGAASRPDDALEFVKDAVMLVLRDAREPVSSRELAAKLGASVSTIRHALRELAPHITVKGSTRWRRYAARRGLSRAATAVVAPRHRSPRAFVVP